jgi:hypothetical protein
MDNAMVTMPTIPNKRVPVAVGFATRERYERYAELTVTFPLNYIPECETFDPLSLPISPQLNSPGCIFHDDGTYMSITIYVNQTLTPSDYSFTMTAIVPGTTPGLIMPEGLDPAPELNMFNLVLRDQYGVVRDAAMRKPAPPLIFGFEAVPASTLYWGEVPGCQISCSSRKLVEVDFMLPFEPEDDIFIEYLLLTLPSGATHRISDERKVATLETSFTSIIAKDTAGRPRVDWKFTDKLGFDIDGMFKVGRNTIKVPINLPDIPSGHNIWYLSFCKDFCGIMRNESVMLTFPYAGFAIGDESPGRPGGASSAFAGLLAVWAWW